MKHSVKTTSKLLTFLLLLFLYACSPKLSVITAEIEDADNIRLENFKEGKSVIDSYDENAFYYSSSTGTTIQGAKEIDELLYKY